MKVSDCARLVYNVHVCCTCTVLHCTLKCVTFSFTRTVNGVYCLLSTCRNDNGEDIFVHQVLCNLCTVHWAIQLQERLSACVIVLTLYWLKLSTQLAPHFFILCLFPFILHPPPVYVSSSNNSTPLLHYFLVIYKFSISMSPSFFLYCLPHLYFSLPRVSRRLSSRTTPTSICAVLAMERLWSSLWSKVPKALKQPRSRVQTELPSRGVNTHVSQYAVKVHLHIVQSQILVLHRNIDLFSLL